MSGNTGSATVSANESPFYYIAHVRSKSGILTIRRGVVPATCASKAMDAVEEMAKLWDRRIQKVELHEVDEAGELVLQTVEDDNTTKSSESVSVFTYASVYVPPTFSTMVLKES
jgi:hypothetical protein